MMIDEIKLFLKSRKAEIGVTEIVFIIASIIGIALILYIVFNFGKSALVIKYD